MLKAPRTRFQKRPFACSALEYQVAQSNYEAVQVRVDAATANVHDLEDARTQSDQLYNTLQDANFELERARITLLRATGELADWVGVK
jgi:outer membrane protein TolC